jgi:hypothetical protein
MKDLKQFIKTTIREFLNENRFENRDEEQYKTCLMSDLTRMELIEMFFNKVEANPNYNTEEPNLFKLIDDWGGYDDQVYIQNNLSDNEFIFWEGWVDECWKGLYLKPEYRGLAKTDSIEKVIRDRFPRIGQEFGFKIKGYNYLKHKGKFIMKVVFYK